MTTVYKFKAYYTQDGVGTSPSSAPVITVLNMVDDSKLVDAQACVASVNGPGVYSYSYNGADGLDVVGLFHTTDTTMDQQDLGSHVSEKITTNINAPLQTIDDLVDTLVARITATRAGYLDNLSGGAVGLEATLSAIKGAGWSTETLAAIYVLLGLVNGKTTNLPAVPAAVGSEMSLPSAYDAAKSAASQASVNAIPTNPLETDDSRLNNLDAAVSSRLASAGYTAPPSVGDIAAAVWASATRTLTSFGTLISGIWTYVTRTLTSSGAGGATAEEVWEYGDRRLTGQSAEVEVTGPVASGGGIQIIAGDDYYNADGRALEWTSEAWPDLTDASVEFVAGDTEIAMAVVTAGAGEQVVRLELSKLQTAPLRGSFKFDVEAQLDTSEHVVTLVRASGVCE